MRHILAFIAVAAISLAAGAQQALFEPASLHSPLVNADHTVTFSYYAPKADSVSVDGDFMPAGQTLAMTRDSLGVWRATTAPLAPELYSYRLVVDGVHTLDPANVYQIRDVSTVFNIFMTGGGPDGLYAVNDVPHGTVSRMWYDSPTLGTTRRLTIYTPAGYEQSGDRRYPVLYLLHGMGGDEEAWIALGRTAQILDNLIARGEAEPMIVVMTNGNVDQRAACGESPEGMVKPDFRHPHTMDGTFETAFPDVVAFVDKTLRTHADKSHRAIAGLSMGGFHSCQISKEYPDMFGYIGLFSAAVNRGTADSPVYHDFDTKLARLFTGKPALYYIAIGRDDFLYDENVDYRRRLDTAGYPYVYRESDGGHTWRNWRAYLADFAPRLFK